MLEDRDKDIQTLKKKLKILGSQLAQADELADFEKEKEVLNFELTSCKAKLLKLEEKGRQWEVDIQLLRNSEAELKARLAAKESELQSKNTKKAIQSTGTTEGLDTSSLSKEMSQIGLKYTELIKLKQQVEELEKERVKEKQGREKAEEKCRELNKQNDNLSQQVIGKLTLQGTRHLIWDQIIIESDKF